VITAVYRNLMASTVSVDLPAAVTEVARDTIGGAVAAAATLPDGTGAALLGAARNAFTEAVVVSALISAGLAIVAAIVTATALRRADSQASSVSA
jgi:DHA2 family multidrug resistance protein-like MFS transporter